MGCNPPETYCSKLAPQRCAEGALLQAESALDCLYIKPLQIDSRRFSRCTPPFRDRISKPTCGALNVCKGPGRSRKFMPVSQPGPSGDRGLEPSGKNVRLSRRFPSAYPSPCPPPPPLPLVPPPPPRRVAGWGQALVFGAIRTDFLLAVRSRSPHLTTGRAGRGLTNRTGFNEPDGVWPLGPSKIASA